MRFRVATEGEVLGAERLQIPIPTDLQALTLLPEWAYAVMRLDKRVENRTKPPPDRLIGKWIALHAGRATKSNASDMLVAASSAGWVFSGGKLTKGGGAVEFSQEEVNRDASSIVGMMHLIDVSPPGTPLPWADPDCYAIRFRLVALPKPIPCKGAQGYWRVEEEVRHAIMQQFLRK
jgi:hypothetical protein